MPQRLREEPSSMNNLRRRKLAYDIAFNSQPIPDGASRTRALTSALSGAPITNFARGLVLISVGTAAYNITNSNDKIGATITEVGGFGGAWMGAATGATLGAAVGGPFAPITGAIGGIIGGFAGWWAGSGSANTIYNAVKK